MSMVLPLPSLQLYAPQLHTLLRRLEAGTLPHGILLTGPRGCGKRLLVDHVVYAMLGITPAGQALLGAGTHPDLLVLAEEEVNLSAVRNMGKFLCQKGVHSATKVVVVDALDALNRFGLNALLKNLEEPPPHAHILLIAHNAAGVPATVASRCYKMRLGQKISWDDLATSWPDYLTQGRPGMALTLAAAEDELHQVLTTCTTVFLWSPKTSTPLPLHAARDLATLMKTHPWGPDVVAQWLRWCVVVSLTATMSTSHTSPPLCPYADPAMLRRVAQTPVTVWLDLWEGWQRLCHEVVTTQTDWLMGILAWWGQGKGY